jgi:hypothetical protein
MDALGCCGGGAVASSSAGCSTTSASAWSVAVSNKLLLSPAGGVALLPNTGLPSLNSAGGFGFCGVLAVLEPFTFFLSSSLFLFSASSALTAAECCVFSSSKFDPVLAIDSVKVASWPGNSLSSSSALPVIESGVVSAVFSSELPSMTSLRGMIFPGRHPKW